MIRRLFFEFISSMQIGKRDRDSFSLAELLAQHDELLGEEVLEILRVLEERVSGLVVVATVLQDPHNVPHKLAKTLVAPAVHSLFYLLEIWKMKKHPN